MFGGPTHTIEVVIEAFDAPQVLNATIEIVTMGVKNVHLITVLHGRHNVQQITDLGELSILVDGRIRLKYRISLDAAIAFRSEGTDRLGRPTTMAAALVHNMMIRQADECKHGSTDRLR